MIRMIHKIYIFRESRVHTHTFFMDQQCNVFFHVIDCSRSINQGNPFIYIYVYILYALCKKIQIFICRLLRLPFIMTNIFQNDFFFIKYNIQRLLSACVPNYLPYQQPTCYILCFKVEYEKRQFSICFHVIRAYLYHISLCTK